MYTALTTVNTCIAPATSTSYSTSSSIKLLSSSSSTTQSTSTSSSNFKTTSSSLISSTLATSTKSSSSSFLSTLTPKSSTTAISIGSSTSSSVVSISTSTSTPIAVPTSTIVSPPAQQTPYGQCGGISWAGLTTCSTGYYCVPQAGNPYYSQCLPASNPPPVSTTTPVVSVPSTTTITTLVSKLSTASATSTLPGQTGACVPTPQNCGVTNSPPTCAGKLQFAGVNIAGCDFGVYTDGSQVPSNAYCPIGVGHPDGPGQMTHFASEKFNIFRLSTGWQYITNSNSPVSTLDPTNWGNFQNLVTACLNTGGYCLIDIHNYARFNGAIIGQGGPSNAVFAQLWANIAAVYASNPKIVFGIMNEPHDLPSITTWAQTVQSAVTAIRNAGATSQMILLPGDGWTGAETFVSSGSGPVLASIVNPDGSYTNLIFDVHKYLDFDGSGGNTVCVGDQVATALAPLAQWLRCNGRQAMLTETGGSSDSSCLIFVCSMVAFLNANSDVYLGYTAWAAGSFTTGYVTSMTPTNNNGTWTDMPITTQCFMPK